MRRPRALEARTLVAGRLGGGSGASDTVPMRPTPATTRGVPRLPGFAVEPARARRGGS